MMVSLSVYLWSSYRSQICYSESGKFDQMFLVSKATLEIADNAHFGKSFPILEHFGLVKCG